MRSSSSSSPASASTTINIAKVARGIAAAISHRRIGNIDHRLVLRLAISAHGCESGHPSLRLRDRGASVADELEAAAP